MRKFIIFCILILFCAFSAYSQMETAYNHVELDEAVQRMADKLSSRIEKGSDRAIAVVLVQAGSNKVSNDLVNKMAKAFLNRAVTVVSREEIDLALADAETALGPTGRIDDKTVQGIGHNTGAYYVARGAFEPSGNSFKFWMKVIRVETAEIAAEDSEYICDLSKLWSIGASAGALLHFTYPGIIGTFYGTFAPLSFSLIKIGLDAGYYKGNIENFDDYLVICPFAHAAFFLPFAWAGSGFYMGAGAGFMWEQFKYNNLNPYTESNLAIDISAGFLFLNRFDISYTYRPVFLSSDTSRTGNFFNTNKISVGYVYRILDKRSN